nr:MAG TPA: hypothetical protein [Caudoviricetes sp.]
MSSTIGIASTTFMAMERSSSLRGSPTSVMSLLKVLKTKTSKLRLIRFSSSTVQDSTRNWFERTSHRAGDGSTLGGEVWRKTHPPVHRRPLKNTPEGIFEESAVVPACARLSFLSRAPG